MRPGHPGDRGGAGTDLPKIPPPHIEALLYQAEKNGILPLTSRCNLACAFCSAAGNPPGLETFSIPPRTMEDIQEHLVYLGESRGPITIGESVTRVTEGEPLTHEGLPAILRLLRESFPQREIRLTTNGTLLTGELSRLFRELDVTVLLSLNTADPRLRSEWMKDPDPLNTLKQVETMAAAGVAFEGSVVALPGLFGMEDIEKTISYLAELGARSVRVLLPGFSRYHPLWQADIMAAWGEIRNLARAMTVKTGIPVLADPPELTGLEARVEGCLKGSPAQKAGLRAGDVILRVNKTTVFSRRHALELARNAQNPMLTVYREGRMFEVTLEKRRFQSPGFVVYDDLDLYEVEEWEAKVRQAGAGKVLILTSALAGALIRDVVARLDFDAGVVEVRSDFFGGNIMAAGLLVLSDFLQAFGESTRGWRPDLVVLPARAFDVWGRDLTGVSYKTFTAVTGVPAILVG
ncbi:MAG: DUF512 domain-containing protein [Firmicutes bacterium]|nr:DUF512 domain-containing protein [Candidatus Fermentithermobacillaceae bacterium]